MNIFNDNTNELSSWIRKEVEFKRKLKNGHSGKNVKRIQEWLNLHGFGVVIDSSYGPVTARAVSRFQEHTNVNISGKINEETFLKLVKPMRSTVK